MAQFRPRRGEAEPRPSRSLSNPDWQDKVFEDSILNHGINEGYANAVKDINHRVVSYVRAAYVSDPTFVTNHGNIDRLTALMAPAVEAGQLQVADLTNAHLSNLFGVKHPPAAQLSMFERPGVDKVSEMARPFWTAIRESEKGKTLAKSLAMGEHRLEKMVETDLQMAKVRQSREVLKAGGITRYSRVTGSNPCWLCAIASTQVYYTEDLLPIHPGCVAEGSLVSVPSDQAGSAGLLGAIQAATRRQYVGEIVELSTASGNFVRVTPNHPVLTDKGWVPAGLIRKGDNVFRSVRGERPVDGRPDVTQHPSRVEDVFAAASVSGRLVRMPVAAEDFHGDTTDGEVEIVWTASDFAPPLDLESIEEFGEPCFMHAHGPGVPLVGAGLQASFLDRGFAPSRGGVRGGGDRFTLSSGGIGIPKQPSLFRPASFDAPAGEFTLESASIYAERGAGLQRRLAGKIERDSVTEYRRVSFTGHVFNLQTSEGWYVSDNLILSNCNCGVAPAVSTGELAGEFDPDQLLLQTDDQSKMMGELVADKDATILDFRKKVAVREHGEIGPTLTWRHQKFTGPSDVAASEAFRPTRQHVSQTAYDVARANGGITIDLAENQPSDGYAYAPLKTTEVSYGLDEFKPEHVEAFIDKNYDELNKPGNNLGLWEQDGRMYIDVSRVGPPTPETLQIAQNADQLAVFDLKHFEEINLGRITDGQYVKLGEAPDLYSQYREQIARANETGSAAGTSALPDRPGGWGELTPPDPAKPVPAGYDYTRPVSMLTDGKYSAVQRPGKELDLRHGIGGDSTDAEMAAEAANFADLSASQKADALARANEIFEQNSAQAAPIRDEMRSVAADLGGILEREYEWGVPTAVKTRGSTYRKVMKAQSEKGTEPKDFTLGDGVRFTVSFSEETYWADTKALSDRMRDNGYRVDEGPNGWALENYRGQNLNFYKDGVFVEVQTHTPYSAFVAEANHPIYGNTRNPAWRETTPPEVITAWEDVQRRNIDAIPVPRDLPMMLEKDGPTSFTVGNATRTVTVDQGKALAAAAHPSVGVGLKNSTTIPEIEFVTNPSTGEKVQLSTTRPGIKRTGLIPKGGTPGEFPMWDTAQSIAAELHARHPDLYEVEFSRSDVKSAHETAKAVDDLATKYPTKKLRGVSEESLAPTRYAETGTPDRFDRKAYRDPLATEVRVNTAFSSDTAYLDRSYMKDVALGFHPPIGDHTPAYAIATHEYAHVLDAAGSFRASTGTHETLRNVFLQQNPDLAGSMRTAPFILGGDARADVQDAYQKWLKDNLSGYSFNEEGFIAPTEANAEAFAHVELSPATANDAERALHKLVVDSSVEPKLATVTEPGWKMANEAKPSKIVDAKEVSRVTPKKPKPTTKKKATKEESPAKKVSAKEKRMLKAAEEKAKREAAIPISTLLNPDVAKNMRDELAEARFQRDKGFARNKKTPQGSPTSQEEKVRAAIDPARIKRNREELWEEISAPVKVEAKEWYPGEEVLMVKIHKDNGSPLDGDPLAELKAKAIGSAFSPQVDWADAKIDAAAYFRHIRDDWKTKVDAIVAARPRMHYTDSIVRADRVVAATTPEEIDLALRGSQSATSHYYDNGPKIRHGFLRNLNGEYDVLTCDTWDSRGARISPDERRKLLNDDIIARNKAVKKPLPESKLRFYKKGERVPGKGEVDRADKLADAANERARAAGLPEPYMPSAPDLAKYGYDIVEEATRAALPEGVPLAEYQAAAWVWLRGSA